MSLHLLDLPPDVSRAIGGIALTFAVALAALLAFYWKELGPRRPRGKKRRGRPHDRPR